MQNVQRAAFMLLCAGCSSLSESTFDENSTHVVAQIRKTERTSTGTHRIGYFVEHTLDWGDCARNGSDDPFELKKRRQRRMLADELQAMVTKAGAADGQFAQRDWLEDGTLSPPTTYRVQQQVQFVPISAMGQNAATLSLELIVRPKTNGRVEPLTVKEEDLKRFADEEMSDPTRSAFKTYDDILTAFSERIQTQCARGVVESIGVDIASIDLNFSAPYERKTEVGESLEALFMSDGQLDAERLRFQNEKAKSDQRIHNGESLALRYNGVLTESLSSVEHSAENLAWVLLLTSAWFAAEPFDDEVKRFAETLHQQTFLLREHSPMTALQFFLIDFGHFTEIIARWKNNKRGLLKQCKDILRGDPTQSLIKTLNEWCDNVRGYNLKLPPPSRPAHSLRDLLIGQFYDDHSPRVFPPNVNYNERQKYELRSDAWERFVFVDSLERLHDKEYPEGYKGAGESTLIDGLRFSLPEGVRNQKISRGFYAPIYVRQMQNVPLSDYYELPATSIFLHALREHCLESSGPTCSEQLDTVFFPKHWGAWSEQNMAFIVQTMTSKLNTLKALLRRVESSILQFTPESQDAALDLRGKLRDLIANDEAVLGWLESIRITHITMDGS